MATPFIFDRWRERYDSMTWEEQIEFYEEVARRWPNQNHYPLGWFKGCLSYISDRLDTFSVLEIGGWTGSMACELLGKFRSVTEWINYEVCVWAADNSICSDERYSVTIPDNFPWYVKLPQQDVFISSHTLEHVKATQIQKLFWNLPQSVRFMAHALPTEVSVGKDWANYGGSHILDCGLNEIDGFAKSVGFSRVETLDGLGSRLYQR